LSYAVKEIFYTLQGEGFNAGRPSVFCRFTGCNLWSGREKDREKAICQFCDTEFVGMDGTLGGRYKNAADLAKQIAGLWPRNSLSKPFAVLTGGEPLLQLDAYLIKALHEHNFDIAIETNGTIPVPDGVDWVCVSPKSGSELVIKQGNELKLVYPQMGIQPETYSGLPFEHLFLQPKDDPELSQNTIQVVDYCKAHPEWRLSFQTHKVLGIP
jgi:7-carboxy-7-deazaguanine synthase